jgi:hypothetical protein
MVSDPIAYPSNHHAGRERARTGPQLGMIELADA